MKKNATAKAFVMSVLSLMLCLSMLVGTTFAWFTDSVTSGVNKIVAGNLDVELEYQQVTVGEDGTITYGKWAKVDPTKSLFMPTDGENATLWEPGHTEFVNLRVHNVGTLALKYQLSVSVYADEEGKVQEQEYTSVLVDETTKTNKKFKLSEHLVYNQKDGATTATNREDLWLTGDAEQAAFGKLDKVGKTETLNPGDHTDLTLAVYMPTWVGNEANYLKGTPIPTIYLGINLFATQVEYENDSFGNDYDKNAWIEENATTNDNGTVELDGKDYVKDDSGEYVEVKQDPETGLYETVVPEGETGKSFVSDNGTMVEVKAGGKDGLYQEVVAEGEDAKLYAQGSEGVVPVEKSATPGLYNEVGGEGALFLMRQNDVAEVEEKATGLYETVVDASETSQFYVNDKTDGIVEVAPTTNLPSLYETVAPEGGESKLYAAGHTGAVQVEADGTTEGLYTEVDGDEKFAATDTALDKAVETGGDVTVLDNVNKKYTDNVTKALNIQSNTNLDLGDKAVNIDSSGGRNGIYIAEGTTTTLSNGIISMNKGWGDYAVVDVEQGEITLDHMTVENLEKDGQCVSAGTDGGKVTIKNSTIIGGDSAFSPAVFCSSQSTVVIENSTIVGGIRAGSNSKVELRGGDYRNAILRSENKDRIIIFSGLFSVNPTIDPGQLYTHGAKLAPGSTIAQNADGDWVVTAAPTAG